MNLSDYTIQHHPALVGLLNPERGQLLNGPKGNLKPVNTTLADYVSRVRDGYELDSLQAAREAGKGSDLYTEVKSLRRCHLLNFRFKNGWKANKNIDTERPTGLMYIDVDSPGYDVQTLDRSKVLIVHRSFGGSGWTIIVRVQGLTLANFQATYYALALELVGSHADKGAAKGTQSLVTGYDPDLFVNEDPTVFQAVEMNPALAEAMKAAAYDTKGKPAKAERTVTLASVFGEVSPTLPSIEAEDSTTEPAEKAPYVPLRFTDAADYVPDGKPWHVFEGAKQPVVKVYPTHRIPAEGGRQNYLADMSKQLKTINPDSSFTQVKNILMSQCERPGMEGKASKIEGIINSTFKYAKEGTLTYTPNHSRRLIFAANSNLTGEEKRSIAAKLMGEFRTKSTHQAIYDAIEDWSSELKITAQTLATLLGKSRTSLQKYLSKNADLKAFMEAKNESLLEPVRVRGAYKPRKPKPQHGTDNVQDLAPAPDGGDAEEAEGPQDSLPGAPDQPDVRGGDQPEPAGGGAEPAEGREERAGDLDAAGADAKRGAGAADGAPGDFLGYLLVQEGMAGTDDQDAHAIWGDEGAEAGSGISAEPGLLSGSDDVAEPVEKHPATLRDSDKLPGGASHASNMNDKDYLAQFESFDDADDWANNKPQSAEPATKPAATKSEPLDRRLQQMTAEEFALYEKLKHDPLKRVKMLQCPAETLAAYKAHQNRKTPTV